MRHPRPLLLEIKQVIFEFINSTSFGNIASRLTPDDIQQINDRLPEPSDGANEIHRLVHLGPHDKDAAKLRQIVLRCPITQLIEKDVYGLTPIHYAARHGDAPMLLTALWRVFLDRPTAAPSHPHPPLPPPVVVESIVDLRKAPSERDTDSGGGRAKRIRQVAYGTVCASQGCGERANRTCRFVLCQGHCRERQSNDGEACGMLTHCSSTGAPAIKKRRTSPSSSAPATTPSKQVCARARCTSEGGESCNLGFCRHHCVEIRKHVTGPACPQHGRSSTEETTIASIGGAQNTTTMPSLQVNK
jgi:hypothetical protein